jgi:alpha-L-rhamnosidase
MKSLFIFILIAISVLIPSCIETEPSAEVYDLRCEGQESPLGIDRMNPVLQWKMKDFRRGAAQTAYQIWVASSPELLTEGKPDLWDSRKVGSDQSVFVIYQGKSLNSLQACFWKLKIWDQEGKESDWSEVASWEMGLLTPSDWKAEWIEGFPDHPQRSVLMRKNILLTSQEITRARLYVTGLGSYVFYINGNRVGEDLLTPGWTDYHKRVEYQVYDVGELLQEGSNALGALLGNMWWSGGLGWEGGAKYSEDPLKLIARLQITFQDGTSQVFTSDSTWKWHVSPIVSDHIYHGEVYDANLQLPGWNDPEFIEDSNWVNCHKTVFKGILSGPRFPALSEQMEINPDYLNEPLPGEYVFDMGQNMVGWARIWINGDKGDTIKLRFAELLHDDGTVAQENLRSAKATDVIVCNGESFSWEPTFTYHGFRYVQVSGLRKKPELTDLVGKVIHTSEPFIGELETSNPLINAIYKNITWGQRGNFFAVPTDCPQRDERLGWMGDAQIFAPTANFNMNLDRFWNKWMTDIADGQDSAGWVHDVSPAIVVGGPAKPGWGDACVIIPWLTYLWYGDRRIIEDYYPVMKKWVDYMYSKSENLIYIWGEKGQWNGYGDWIAPEPTPSEPIGTAYFCYSSGFLSKMASVIGKTTDAAFYGSLASKIATAYQMQYWDKDSLRYPGNTQTANLLPLAFGITPDELKDQVVQNLIDRVEARNAHPYTGFLGTGYILKVLSATGNHDLAYQMINQTTYPSWGYMVDKGATSIWELWNSDTEKPEGMNSRNHFALGCVGEWMWNTLAGIQICEEFPGFKRIIIKPEPVGDLKTVNARYETNFGRLLVNWSLDKEGLNLHLEIPPNTSALLIPPVIEPGVPLKENGKNVMENKLPGIKIDNRQILLSAGTYNFKLE